MVGTTEVLVAFLGTEEGSPGRAQIGSSFLTVIRGLGGYGQSCRVVGGGSLGSRPEPLWRTGWARIQCPPHRLAVTA